MTTCKCPTCSKIIPTTSKFCRRCGVSIAPKYSFGKQVKDFFSGIKDALLAPLKMFGAMSMASATRHGWTHGRANPVDVYGPLIEKSAEEVKELTKQLLALELQKKVIQAELAFRERQPTFANDLKSYQLKQNLVDLGNFEESTLENARRARQVQIDLHQEMRQALIERGDLVVC
jgi:hypothetical protein